MSSERSVALVTAPALIEEWLDPLGVSLETFRDTMTGGWMFNYAEALATAGIRMSIVCFSEWVDRPESFEHRPTGATIWMVPPGRKGATARRWVGEPELEGARDPRSLARGVRRHVAPYLLTPPRALLDVLRRDGCDAILSQDYDSQRFDLCVALGRVLRVPVFATFQGGFFPPSHIGRLTRPAALRAAAGLIVAAGEELDRVRRDRGVPEDKLARIPNPLDIDVWRPVPRPEAREALGIPADARVAITHGRVDIWDKGLDVLLEAWSRMSAERPGGERRLFLVGSGDDKAEVARMIATGGYPGARLVDEFIVDQALLRRWLSAADVFAFAGRFEGFPVAVAEAMACGLGAVATDASGIPDLFEGGEDHGGVVVPRDDASALAAALGRVLDDAELSAELGRRARRRVEDYCSLASVGRQLEAFMTRRGMRSA